MKKLLSFVLAAALAFSTVVVTTEPVNAATTDWSFNGYTCTSNASAASTINYILAKYEQFDTYTGSGQCYGWAEKVGNMLAASRSTKYYSGLKFNKTNFKKKCLNVKAGTHLRLSHNKEYNGASGHSICLLKVTNDQVCWTDNNYSGYETIAFWSASLDAFVNYYSQYEYLNMTIKTTKYKTQSEPLLSTEKTADGRTKLFWTKTTSTSKYKVYRATSKNGKYKLIKTTTAKSYKDTTAKYGTKYYYKVKSVKKSSSDKTSSIKYSTARLNTPVISDWSNNEKTGKIKITWTKVANADKYYIYRSKNGGTYKFYAATKKTSYTDPNAANPANRFSYKVKAVYSKNTKGNSLKSDASYWLYPDLAAPTVTSTYDETTNDLTLTWKKVPYATYYRVYYRENYSEDWYGYFNSTEERTFTIDLDTFYEDNTYEFWVCAYCTNGSSAPSEYVEYYIPDDGIDDDYYWYY